MNTTIYQNKDFILIRKPHGIPSTFGKVESFLDILKQNISDHTITRTPLSELVPEDIFPLVSSRLIDFEAVKKVEENEEILRQQVDTFGEDQEFGLLNRLDNETGGFLYFAKNIDAFHQFKNLQKSEKIQKFYLAQIEGRINSQSSTCLPVGKVFHLQFPIMHHKSNPDKMIAIRDPQDVRFGRSQQHEV
ncbi:MAG: pseudouridine synthase, partial [candidate division SR1 bacterium]|nr:pseudouridine synthase [candidate division SR1 bacterium]